MAPLLRDFWRDTLNKIWYSLKAFTGRRHVNVFIKRITHKQSGVDAVFDDIETPRFSCCLLNIIENPS